MTTTTKPRSDSTSRNDLFNTSWATEVRPPRPLNLPHAPLAPSPNASPRLAPSTLGSTLPRLKKDGDSDISEFGLVASTATTTVNASATVPSPQASRTSSFFDKPTELPLPPRSGLPAPSPLNLSRSSSLRNRPAPLPLDIGTSSNHINPNSQKAGPSAYAYPKPLQTPPIDTEPLSPLHQSPSLPAMADWNPPRPPLSDDISLRLDPKSSFLLGEGRYATVYLASYKKDRKEKGRSRNPYLSYGPAPAIRVKRQPSNEISPISPIGGQEVNEEGDGFVGGQWRLCAAKRMAPDRQSQTMGLREAFFLNRLSATATSPISLVPTHRPGNLRVGARQRAVSPLRDGLSRRGSSPTGNPTKRREDNGSVYVVKLVAVKEDIPPRTPAAGQGHGRSVSDAVQDTGGRGLVRQRSSTMLNRYKSIKDENQDQPINSLNSHPSLPSLVKAAQEIETTPALSRLVLILEHAPLGTMDRFLRTSPGLVGKRLWERWAVQTTEALSWVHGKGIVHADIKAGNLLLTANLDVRLSDFGSSLLIHPSHPPTDGVGLGTLPFSPPELVDPESTFSFPVDIFSLGATLYQCITGREPYRGCRTVEMMHHVRKGGLWNYEERERLGRIGQEREESVIPVPSPYPSAWRHDYPAGGVRRAGSLRVPNQKVFDRPKLGRMGSTESLRASEDVGHGDSPAAVRLWGKWISNPHTGTDPISLLLADDVPSPTTPTHSSTSRSGLKVDISSASPTASDHQSPIPVPNDYDTGTSVGREPTGPAYSDGSPAMFFLDGQERVEEGIWKILRAMTLPHKESRPTAEDVRKTWQDLGLRLQDDVDEAEAD